MTKSKLVGERLKEILVEFAINHDSSWVGIEEAHTAILALFKSIMPEEATYSTWDKSDPLKWGKEYSDVITTRVNAWNSYRTELLKRLEEK